MSITLSVIVLYVEQNIFTPNAVNDCFLLINKQFLSNTINNCLLLK